MLPTKKVIFYNDQYSMIEHYLKCASKNVKDQGHILFPIEDYVDAHVKINSAGSF